MTPSMWIASGAWILMVVGLLNRRRRSVHIPCMVAAIAADVVLVLYLQVTRGAIQSAIQFERPLLEMAHIGASTVALILYFPVLYYGIPLARRIGTGRTKAFHIRYAVTAFIFRTLGFVLMFSMWKP